MPSFILLKFKSSNFLLFEVEIPEMTSICAAQTPDCPKLSCYLKKLNILFLLFCKVLFSSYFAKVFSLNSQVWSSMLIKALPKPALPKLFKTFCIFFLLSKIPKPKVLFFHNTFFGIFLYARKLTNNFPTFLNFIPH